MTDRDTGALSPGDEQAAIEFLAVFGEHPEAITLSRNMLITTTLAPKPTIDQIDHQRESGEPQAPLE